MKVYQLLSLLESQPANTDVLISVAETGEEGFLKPIARIELAGDGDTACVIEIGD